MKKLFSILLFFSIFIFHLNSLQAYFDAGLHVFQTDKRSNLAFSPAIMGGYTFAEKDQEGLQSFVRVTVNPVSVLHNIFAALDGWVDGKTYYHFAYYAGAGLKYQLPIGQDLFLTTEASLNYFFLETLENWSKPDAFFAPIYGIGVQHSLSGVNYMLHFIPYHKKFGTLEKDRLMLTIGISF